MNWYEQSRKEPNGSKGKNDAYVAEACCIHQTSTVQKARATIRKGWLHNSTRIAIANLQL
ncbi:hypothetical protein [Nostoc sp. DedQUE03]|uniref:hypothetical protein n=1 Tax=Nostoc sp. DedQUE03 TaxID=3075389 RepID=UPI002AD1DF33|nr:hypothetical protein [Nostoc sp. DedQUE03]MDZ7976633.1 hypothetical protein [Nostoc sp. DedQUE03]MDZ8049821.1 hypothetical protein [Nostoc sp. DedQUE02]